MLVVDNLQQGTQLIEDDHLKFKRSTCIDVDCINVHVYAHSKHKKVLHVNNLCTDLIL